MLRWLIFVMAAWSGFFVMAVEILGGRYLAPSFGSSIYVWGAVITVFMLALSLGYLLGGRLSVRRPSLRKLGGILIAAGLSVLPVLMVGESLLDWVFYSVRDPRYGSLLACFGLFFVPTAISGMVSPYCVRLLVDELATTGERAGMLYFVSTFGSAAGTLLTSFYLVLWFEINHIFSGLIAVSVAAGLLALPFGRIRHEQQT